MENTLFTLILCMPFLSDGISFPCVGECEDGCNSGMCSVSIWHVYVPQIHRHRHTSSMYQTARCNIPNNSYLLPFWFYFFSPTYMAGQH